MAVNQETYNVWYGRDEATGIVVCETWSKNYPDTLSSKLHRIDGPARIKRHPTTGVVIDEEWHRDGNLHRENGPAIIRRTPEGKVKYTSWYQNGQLIPQRRRKPSPLPARRPS